MSDFSPNVIAVLGFGEAGSAIASGLCAPGGWRANCPDRQLMIVDTAYARGARGRSMMRCAETLRVPAQASYDKNLLRADAVICVVTGEDAISAARMAKPLLRPGTLYADYNSITAPQTQAVAEEFSGTGIDFVDVAVMGSFLASGHRAPLLLAGPRAEDMRAFAEQMGAPARVLSERIGDASAVKILRSVLMKGIEALSVECLVAAHRQGLVQQVLDNVGDVDALGFAQFVRVLTVTHVVHARRRMEEVEKAIQNLHETNVPALMSEAVRRSHLRTVDAALDPQDVAGLDLDQALRLLDERVVGFVSETAD